VTCEWIGKTINELVVSLRLALAGMLELERTMPDDLFRLTVPPPTEDCYTSNGYLKKKCRYDKKLADLQKV